MKGDPSLSDTSHNLVAPVLDRIIHLSVWMSKPPSQLFPYFIESTHLQSWLTALAEVEPKPGGKYELYWEPSDRDNNSTIGCRITAIADGQLLAFQWRSPEQFKSFANGADPLTHVTIAFIAERSGTQLHLVHSGWRSGPDWEAARLWQERAWSGALRELERIVHRSP
jgi:uncharacterized protein YndB with AHSA1/START domain